MLLAGNTNGDLPSPDKQLEYWVKQLESSQSAELLCDKPRPAALSGETDAQDVTIEGALYERLRDFCSTREVTPFVVLLAAFRATQYRLTNTEDATVGVPSPKRNVQDPKNSGVDLQCIRIRIQNESFEELARQVQVTVQDALAHQDVPYKRIIAELDLESRRPLVRIAFAVHPKEHMAVETEPLSVLTHSSFDIEFQLFEGLERFTGTVTFASELFELQTISNMLIVFYQVLQQGLSEPYTPIASLSLDSGLSTMHDMGLMQTETDYPRESSVIDVFRQQVEAYPDTVAVKDSSLDLRSDELAGWLAQKYFATEALVGVLAPRSCETAVAFLGILKANLAYVPLDAAAPVGRIETILSSIKNRMLVLLGPGIQRPNISLQNVEYASIAEILRAQKGQPRSKPSLCMPSATSLAYVMFTSGSTGMPKGVMIEHRGIVRLVKQTNLLSPSLAARVISHITNLAFDVSQWEIYVALLNGGTLVCIDRMTVLDPALLSQVFIRERIRVAMFTPVLLKQCLQDSPDAIKDLDALFAAGDRLHVHDANKVHTLMNGEVFNAYGPTENSVISTVFHVPRNVSNVNGMPIGRAVSNSGAYVMDDQQQLVPIGVIGELVVTGDGLARGYTDPEQNRNRFVQVVIDGQTLKAYRTGDFVRYRVADGQLEFFGRRDHQVKIRGHRIELGEIDQNLLNHGHISDAVTLLREQTDQEPELVSFVTFREDDDFLSEGDQLHDGNSAEGQVEGWSELFDTIRYAQIDEIDSKKLGRDFMGWISMYNYKEIDKSEMNEWLEDTITDILDGGCAGDVFEVGTGTGMILFNLLDGLRSYVGLEPATSAVAYVKRNTNPELAHKIDVRIGTAADITQLKGLNAPNLAIVNSTAQCFPSQEYLLQTVKDLLSLRGVERVYFGDMRSYALYAEFQISKALHVVGEDASKDEVRRQLAEIERVEEELLTDPAFFTDLEIRLPNLVEHVEILPKKMKATNELSCYRYAAVVHAKRPQELTRQVYDIPDHEWIDFSAGKMNRETLLQLLQDAGGSTVVAVGNIPHSKTIFERHVVDALASQTEEEENWLGSVREAALRCPSLSATDLVELGQAAGFRVELSWARQFSQRGSLDAVFHRLVSSPKGARVLFRFPTEHKGRPYQSFTNQPLRQRMILQLEKQLRNAMQAKLPSYMVPTVIRTLKRMPVNENGKVDRRALATSAQRMVSSKAPSAHQPPRNDRILCEQFADVLGIEIGITENFFDLGGHSLMATRVVSRINKQLHAAVKVKDIYDCPVVARLSDRIRPLLGLNQYTTIPRVDPNIPVGASYSQQLFLILERMSPGSSRYHMPRSIRIRGALRLDALNAAFQALEERHDTFRTTFEQRDGGDVQIIRPFRPKELRVIDMPDSTDFAGILEKEQNAPFDFEAEPPWRCTVYRFNEEEFVLSVVMHHILYDGWSIGIFCRELSIFYSAALQGHDPLSAIIPLPIQYRDFAAWERLPDQVIKEQRQLEYWIKQLDGNCSAELPFDKQRPPVTSGVGGAQEIEIAGTLYEGLQKFCKENQVTPFTVLLATFRATHYYFTGVEDATIGIPTANRNRQEVEGLIGVFVNAFCIRTKIYTESFKQLIQQVQVALSEAYENQDISFSKVAAQALPAGLDPSRFPLFQMAFAIDPPDVDSLKLQGVETKRIILFPPEIRVDLEVHLHQRQKCLDGQVLFERDLYEPQTIRRMISVFYDILHRCINDPLMPVKNLVETSSPSVPLENGLDGFRGLNEEVNGCGGSKDG